MYGRDSRIANSQTKTIKRKYIGEHLPAAVHQTIDNPQLEKERMFVIKPKQKEFDAESKASGGNLLHNKDFLEQNYNDSNFDMYSMHGHAPVLGYYNNTVGYDINNQGLAS